MKKHLIKSVFALIGAFLFLTACSKDYHRVTINRDCTGTYIRMNCKDYRVSNPATIKEYEDGCKVRVKFQFDECGTISNETMCMLYHQNNGLVHIIEIN